jgi:DNA topoisomerase-3
MTLVASLIASTPFPSSLEPMGALASSLPYCLSALQVEASHRLGLSPKVILECCQALYENHRLTTYPRSDCSYLPEAHFADATQVLSSIAANRPELAALAKQADTSRRSRAWNNSKVTAHHALIPTPAARPSASLSSDERGVYDLIARRYIAQFYPPYEFHHTTLEILVGDQRFRAVDRVPIEPGWKHVLAEEPPDHVRSSSATDSLDAESATPLPALHPGDKVAAAGVTIIDRKTTPPKRFTDATLLEAMGGIARFVSNPEIKKVLQDTDGLGTPATQSSIIQTLYDRGYVEKHKSHVISTGVGRTLIATLPPSATTPDMTALWEAAMKRIAKAEMPLSTFLAEVLRQLQQLVTRGITHGPLKIPGARPCPAPNCGGVLLRRRGLRGAFLSCSRYPECRTSHSDERSPSPRPQRGQGTLRRKAP